MIQTTIAKNNKKNKKTKQKEITTKKKTKRNNKHELCSTTPKSIHDQHQEYQHPAHQNIDKH